MKKKKWGVWITDRAGARSNGRWLREDRQEESWRGSLAEAEGLSKERNQLFGSGMRYEPRKHSLIADIEELRNEAKLWEEAAKKFEKELEGANLTIAQLENYRAQIRQLPDQETVPKGKAAFQDHTGMIHHVDEGTNADYRIYRFIRVYCGGTSSMKKARQYLRDRTEPLL